MKSLLSVDAIAYYLQIALEVTENTAIGTSGQTVPNKIKHQGIRTKYFLAYKDLYVIYVNLNSWDILYTVCT